jgi:hypothetical protein
LANKPKKKKIFLYHLLCWQGGGSYAGRGLVLEEVGVYILHGKEEQLKLNELT